MFPPPAIRMVFRILLATLVLLGSRTFALEVTRGPYLQTGTPTGITIRWRTDVPVESVVHYGTEANRLHQTEKDLQETTEHVVRLSGLEPDTRYFYSVGRF